MQFQFHMRKEGVDLKTPITYQTLVDAATVLLLDIK